VNNNLNWKEYLDEKCFLAFDDYATQRGAQEKCQALGKVVNQTDDDFQLDFKYTTLVSINSQEE